MNPIHNLNKIFYGIAICSMFCFNKINHIINTRDTPVRLEKVEDVSWREKYEVELIFAAGIGLIIILFLIAFSIGASNPTIKGVI